VTKRTPAKHKIDRRMGENIWGDPNHLLIVAIPDPVNMASDEKVNFLTLAFSCAQSKS